MSSEQRRNLAPRGWHPEVHRALLDLLDRAPAGEAVVFDFDNTCILGDVGELFGHFMVQQMRYRYDLDAFWELVHPEDGREALRELTEAALELSAHEREGSPLYERYLAQMSGLYGRRLQRAGKRDCYEWAVRLHVGLSEEEMTSWSKEVIARELIEPRRRERYRCDDGHVAEVQRGIRPFVEIYELMRALEAAGLEIWIVSASNIWTVRAFADHFGLPQERVLGNRVAVEEGRLTDKTRIPALYREGKMAIIEEVIGKTPVLVAGDAVTDYEMLCGAGELALVIDRGDELLRKEGRKRGWLMQPQQQLTARELR